MKHRLIPIAVSLAACAPTPLPPTAAPAAPSVTASATASAPSPTAPATTAAFVRVADNTERKTASGARYIVPAGWSFRAEPSMVVLEAPEPDTHLALVEVDAKTADDAVAAAWKAYAPTAARKLKLSTPRPARKGWDERRVFDYDIPPNERAVVQVIAMRKAATWVVLVVDGKEGTFEKRISQVVLFDDMLRPSGWTPETFAGKKAHTLDPARVKRLTDFIETAQKELGVPGVGLALLQGGKVVFKGGLGVRELGKNERVDADTQFMIASNTKGMTTLLLAKLVDEGKLTWDTPVTKVFPSFRLGDDKTTEKVLVKHLVCACTGLPREDMPWLFEFKHATPQSTMDLLAGMQPTTAFGETFQYSNMLAAAGGFVAAHVTSPKQELGKAYDDAMQSKVFAPLGMRGVTFDTKRALRGNHASPHGDDMAGGTVVARMDLNHAIDPFRPAGGAWASAADLAKYVQLELDSGKLPNGKVYVSEANLLERRTKQVSIGADTAYGMGLEVDTTWSTPVVHHGGSLFGYKSDWYALPEHGVGAVLLTNSNSGSALLRPFLRRLMEVLFDAQEEAVEDLATRARNRKAQLAKAREPLSIPPDEAAVAALAARYTHKALGDLDVKKQGNTVVFDFGEFSTTVASRKHADGSVVFETTDAVFRGTELVVSKQGDKRALVLRDAQHEYVFVETP